MWRGGGRQSRARSSHGATILIFLFQNILTEVIQLLNNQLQSAINHNKNMEHFYTLIGDVKVCYRIENYSIVSRAWYQAWIRVVPKPSLQITEHLVLKIVCISNLHRKSNDVFYFWSNAQYTLVTTWASTKARIWMLNPWQKMPKQC